MKKRKAIIKTFGEIRENKTGGLEFTYFVIELAEEFDRTDIGLLTLVKERIEKEIESLKRSEPAEVLDLGEHIGTDGIVH